MTINFSMLDNFKKHLTDEEKSKATLEKYTRDILSFIKWISGKQLCKQIVLEYKKHLIETYSPASVNSILSSLNSFFDFNHMYEFKVKMLKIQKQIFIRKEKELTKAEYERLLCAAKSKNNERLYLIIKTICSSGIRVSELRAITAEAVKKQKATINCKGKMRVVLLPSALCKSLLAYTKRKGITSGPVFITKNGNPIDRSTIWKMMKSLCESANVSSEKVFPHNLRHLFARTYYALEKDIVRLADILGHTSVNTTRIYTMESGEVHRRQIEKLGFLRI